MVCQTRLESLSSTCDYMSIQLDQSAPPHVKMQNTQLVLGRTNPISRISRRDNPKISVNLLPRLPYLEEKLPDRISEDEDRACAEFQVEISESSRCDVSW